MNFRKSSGQDDVDVFQSLLMKPSASLRPLRSGYHRLSLEVPANFHGNYRRYRRIYGFSYEIYSHNIFIGLDLQIWCKLIVF